ncbi:MAG: prepilin-type N-terminal cleavage/methylation domain-containing protein [Planctomycetes bacterium]|nr:prepilin-type N-terminal cleavage/methylation domain-containing protein [Planctomycetota bacterium]
MIPRRLARKAGGYTLVEVTISAAILGVLLLSVGLTTMTGNRAYKAGMAQNQLAIRGQRAVDRIADEIAMSGATGLTPNPTAPLGSSTLTFRTPNTYSSGSVSWTNSTRLDFQYLGTDRNDGVDNDGNGFVDDGAIVLTRNVGLANETETVLVRGVSEYLEGETANGADDNGNGLTDERGLSFVLAGDQLTIRVSLANRDDNGATNTNTITTSIKVRN